MKYLNIPLDEAYRLLNPGPLVLVASKGKQYDLAPIAWNCPVDYEPVTRLLFVCDPTHQTAHNVKESGQFAVCIPHTSQAPLVENCGSVSSPDVDKFTQFDIPYLSAEKMDLRIPADCVGWIECTLTRVIPDGGVEIFIGEAVAAFVQMGAWDDGLIRTSLEAKVFHHW